MGDDEAGRGGRRIGDGEADRDISLLFDVFVVHQRVRALLARTLAGSELRADEYAVYSVLFERGALTPTQLAAGLAMPVTTVLDYLRVMTRRGHIGRARNPVDGRSYTVSLTAEGLRAHRSTNALWEVGVRGLEGALRMPVAEVRAALQALDDAAGAALAQFTDAERVGVGSGLVAGSEEVGAGSEEVGAGT